MRLLLILRVKVRYHLINTYYHTQQLVPYYESTSVLYEYDFLRELNQKCPKQSRVVSPLWA